MIDKSLMCIYVGVLSRLIVKFISKLFTIAIKNY